MPSIYITENLYNKANGIMPWRYIGSDQYDRLDYFGSSRDLKKDIVSLGPTQFKKTVIVEFDNIDNKELRKIEATQYLKPLDVRKDETYYNKTDHYGPGCVKGSTWKHKKTRSEEHCAKIIEHRTGSTKNAAARQLMREKKLGTKQSEETKQKRADSNRGENNNNALVWDITTPTGVKYTVKSLRNWCIENQINYYTVYFNRRGWTAIKHGTGNNSGTKHKKVSINGI